MDARIGQNENARSETKGTGREKRASKKIHRPYILVMAKFPRRSYSLNWFISIVARGFSLTKNIVLAVTSYLIRRLKISDRKQKKKKVTK